MSGRTGNWKKTAIVLVVYKTLFTVALPSVASKDGCHLLETCHELRPNFHDYAIKFHVYTMNDASIELQRFPVVTTNDSNSNFGWQRYAYGDFCSNLLLNTCYFNYL